MPLKSIPILTASSYYVQACNVNIPSSSVIKSSLSKHRVVEVDATNVNEECQYTNGQNFKRICSVLVHP